MSSADEDEEECGPASPPPGGPPIVGEEFIVGVVPPPPEAAAEDQKGPAPGLGEGSFAGSTVVRFQGEGGAPAPPPLGPRSYAGLAEKGLEEGECMLGPEEVGSKMSADSSGEPIEEDLLPRSLPKAAPL
jgi:hypothetical protein